MKTTAKLAVWGAGTTMLLLTLYAWVRISGVYEKRLRQAYDLILADDKRDNEE